MLETGTRRESEALLARYRRIGGYGNQIKELDFLYSVLAVIDSKASALMTVNAIIAATLGVLIGSDLTQRSPTIFGVAVLLMIGSLISALMCLTVTQIEWPFLSGFTSWGPEAKKLDETIEKRTSVYKDAWNLTFVLLFYLVVFLVWFLLVGLCKVT